jgi:hypothetical protein
MFSSDKDSIVTSDPAFLFLTEQYREALAGLTCAILQPSGLRFSAPARRQITP